LSIPERGFISCRSFLCETDITAFWHQIDVYKRLFLHLMTGLWTPVSRLGNKSWFEVLTRITRLESRRFVESRIANLPHKVMLKKKSNENKIQSERQLD
jgi:hypothetical protein